MKSSYLDNVYAQPDTLVSAAEQYANHAFGVALNEAAALLRGRAVTSTGMGASYFALQASRAAMDRAMSRHWIDETSYLEENLETLTRPMDALVVVSQSGETVEGRKLLPRLRKLARVLVTRDTTSALVDEADVVLSQHCPADLSVSVQTYITQIAVLELLSARVQNRPTTELITALHRCAEVIRRILTDATSDVEAASQILSRTSQIYALGRGSSIASALGTALLFKEGAKRDCEAQSAAQFRHGAVEVVSSNTGVIVFADGSGATRQLDLNLIGELTSYGARVVVISGTDFPACGAAVHLRIPDTPAEFRSIAEIVPSQLMVPELARTNGVTAGEFRNTVPVIVSA